MYFFFLFVADYLPFRPPRLSKDYKERCISSLLHCIKGLRCLRETRSKPSQKNGEKVSESSPSQTPEKSQPDHIDELNEPKMANIYESIPLPYKSLNSSGSNSPVPATENNSSNDVQRNISNNGNISETASHVVSQMTSEDKSENPGPVVPTSQKLEVSVSGESYDVKDWNSKFKVLLLHKSAEVYRLLAEDSISKKNFSEAVNHIKLCIECCYAVCLHLNQTSVSDATLRPQILYGYLKKALVRAAEIFYLRAKNWNSTIGVKKEQSLLEKDFIEANEDMKKFLRHVMPETYRAQFEVPMEENSFSYLEMAQCYLFLATGCKLKNPNTSTDFENLLIFKNLLILKNQMRQLLKNLTRNLVKP